MRPSVIVNCCARLLVVALGAALAASPSGAQERLTQVTVDDALRRNPTLQAKEAEVRSVKANEITAGLHPNPSAGYSVEQLGLKGTEPEHTISLGQKIEAGGKRRHRIEAARAATTVTGHQLVDLRRQITLEVKAAFTNALVARELQELAQQNLRTLDETERLQRLRVQRGEISQLELLRIEVQRFTFDIVGELRFTPLTLDREELMRRAIENRPDLRAALADRVRARADHELARANAWWDFTPQVIYQRVGPDNTIGVGISMDFRIFDRNQGEIARTRAEIDRAEGAQVWKRDPEELELRGAFLAR